ncbi:MAG: hypothetical protein HS111_24575 [Kofleriaceae bacterium]|nr:hypothetical protein [Kofleriaceae bacterium]
MAIAARGRAVGRRLQERRHPLRPRRARARGHRPGVRLGGGWVNPAGLRWTATGCWSRPGRAQARRRAARPLDADRRRPRQDVTATADVDGARWIATRRGLVRAAP